MTSRPSGLFFSAASFLAGLSSPVELSWVHSSPGFLPTPPGWVPAGILSWMALDTSRAASCTFSMIFCKKKFKDCHRQNLASTKTNILQHSITLIVEKFNFQNLLSLFDMRNVAKSLLKKCRSIARIQAVHFNSSVPTLKITRYISFPY